MGAARVGEGGWGAGKCGVHEMSLRVIQEL